jgi:hypothetical protein
MNIGCVGAGGMQGAYDVRNEKLLWDARNLRFANNEKANEFVKSEFRKGWELEGITA